MRATKADTRDNKEISWSYFSSYLWFFYTAEVELVEGSGSRLLFKCVALFFLFSNVFIYNNK